MIISAFLLVTLLPYLTLTASVQVGIVNGTEAKPHSRPYMVSIQRNKKHTCGGFLVSEQFVMTAAHCFNEGEKLTVVVGAHDYTRDSGRMGVKFYHIHPGYQPKTLLNDIMLLQLNRKVDKSKVVNWISIPKKDKEIKAKVKCSVAGWGKKNNSSTPSAKLMEVDVTIIDKKECLKYWRKDYSVSRMVCAGGRGGFCQGDSGGPLVCNNVAVGVVSFNEKDNCDSPKRPNVYTKISKFLKWINAILDGVKINKFIQVWNDMRKKQPANAVVCCVKGGLPFYIE
ncbi:mast cell protease 1A-like isoform X1 [Onychostoma macrolepis]|uniref:mast cell protease 1A-like isoform X1 n=1 Tax=Onychostoma macrolepis TaxID=369639 RepID=UPI00272D67C6|nr:mast cell protease 1A-like isoform X1 [Onychostoma macrolepis]